MNLRQSQIELLKELRDFPCGEVERYRIVNKVNSYDRLIKKGLILKTGCIGYTSYKLTSAGLAELKRLEGK